MLYQMTDGTVSVGGQVILSHADFVIKGNEKIGLVGKNGAGKTTLLRVLSGGLSLDRDDRRQGPGILSSRELTIGMLTQTRENDLKKTVEELLVEGCPVKDRYAQERFLYEMEYDRMFTGLGFEKEQKKRKLAAFSGGEQTRIALIRLLLMKPDLLLLDEPTNHLDLNALSWLEEYLQHYDKAVVVVSHDRFFLDRVVSVIYEVKNGRLTRYAGNYTAFREQKRQETAQKNKAYQSQQEEIKRLNDLIERFKQKPRKAAFARSRKTILERMEKLERPEPDDAHIFTGEITPIVAPNKWILDAKELQVGYDRCLASFSLRVRSGSRIGIIGDNGAGKTTLLKTIAGFLPALKGTFHLGERTTIGYFDQKAAELSSDKTVLEHFHGLFPVLTEKDLRHTLASYLFRGSDVSKKVSSLSGGEKARLLMAELLESRPNLLLLDEPTNHMDIPAKETLESALQAYKGTILFVSHDRYFIRQVADAILVMDGSQVMYYPFGYDHYLSRKDKGEGENLTALLRAEDQAMLEEFKKVPEKEKGRLREIGTEELYRDWRVRLAREDLAEAEAEVFRLLMESPDPPGLAAAEDRWTACCIAFAEAKGILF